MKIENLSTLKINQLTQEQYERLKAEDEINDNELYFTPASPTGGGTDVAEYAYSKTETDLKLAEYAKTSDLDEYAKTTDVNSKQDKLSFDGTYDAVTNKVATEKTVVDKIAAVVANAPEDFDTLKEMSDWIDSHKGSAAEMNSSIEANADAIRDIQNAGYAKTSDIPSKVSQLENDTKYVNETQLNEAIANVGGGSGDVSGKLDANGWETGVDTPYLRYIDNVGNEIKLSPKGIYHCSTANNTDAMLSFPEKSGTIALDSDKLNVVTKDEVEPNFTGVYGVGLNRTRELYRLVSTPKAGTDGVAYVNVMGGMKVLTSSIVLDTDVTNKKYVDDAVANAGSGGGKLYKHNLTVNFVKTEGNTTYRFNITGVDYSRTATNYNATQAITALLGGIVVNGACYLTIGGVQHSGCIVALVAKSSTTFEVGYLIVIENLSGLSTLVVSVSDIVYFNDIATEVT
jgi:hypothetical protein